MATVDLEGVEKVYPGGARALARFDLSVADGERVVVVGPSGCGKTTVLRLLAGLEDPTSGTLRIGGHVVNGRTPQERNVAMVFQDYALYPHMTVRENLAFPLRMRRLARAEMSSRIDRVAAMLALGAELDRLPRQLSGGQRQRVAMGRALVREPSVFLLDEPLSNLDAKLRGQVRNEIADLQRQTGTTMLYVTHDQSEAMTLGDRVAVLDRGVLQQVAAPRELYERPANLFVAGFVGSPPMNLFPARIEVGARGASLRIGDQLLALGASRPAAATGESSPSALTAGIRPEAFRLVPAERSGSALRAIVDHVEWLGHETLARVAAGSDANAVRLVVRLSGVERLSRGDPVALEVAPGDVHLFDAGGRRADQPLTPPVTMPRT
jgi:ABC-type sugar transport system ATPase subunit